MKPHQAAIKIQRAWRKIFYKRCPYCLKLSCSGNLSQFNCEEMWEPSQLHKLDVYLNIRMGLYD